MISIIQIILAAGILTTGLYSYRRLRSSYLDAILIFSFMAIGFLFVFFPELSNKVAHFVGVTRGADMIFYISILFFLFLIMKLYAKIRRLEQIITDMIRDESIKNATSQNEDITKEFPKSEPGN
jgi:small membrane protein